MLLKLHKADKYKNSDVAWRTRCRDRLKKVWAKIVELWKKYSNKQKAIIGSIIGIVILMIIILTVLLNKINYTKLYTFEDVTTAKNAVAILDKMELHIK